MSGENKPLAAYKQADQEYVQYVLNKEVLSLVGYAKKFGEVGGPKMMERTLDKVVALRKAIRVLGLRETYLDIARDYMDPDTFAKMVGGCDNYER